MCSAAVMFRLRVDEATTVAGDVAGLAGGIRATPSPAGTVSAVASTAPSPTPAAVGASVPTGSAGAEGPALAPEQQGGASPHTVGGGAVPLGGSAGVVGVGASGGVGGEALRFSIGNPNVCLTVGRIRLFRDLRSPVAPPGAAGSVAAGLVDLLVVAVPPRMTASLFCTFMGAGACAVFNGRCPPCSA